jgi:hypothetical protein
MAILQISQIQVRRGLNQDLPQLASGELGWSIDTQQLYIGNGTIAEGAPQLGVTQIVTSNQLAGFLGSYTYKGLATGFTTVTGTSILSPVYRTLQAKLDDIVNVRDFGAIGNGIADDTAAINRAIQNVYLAAYNGNTPITQRQIIVPAGNYLISGPILLPPNCTLRGDGKNNTVINIGNNATYAAVTTCDNQFEYANSIGISFQTVLPSYITVTDIEFATTSNVPVMIINSATDVIVERCQFNGGTYGVSVIGASSIIKLNYCTFKNNATAPLNIANSVTGLVSRNDHLDTTQAVLSTGTSQITTLSNAGYIDYQIVDSSNNIRFGKLKYSVNNGVASFDEEYNEPAIGLGANLYVWSGNANLTCTVTNTSTLKYQNKIFT